MVLYMHDKSMYNQIKSNIVLHKLQCDDSMMLLFLFFFFFIKDLVLPSAAISRNYYCLYNNVVLAMTTAVGIV
jgi:hypothetical protein